MRAKALYRRLLEQLQPVSECPEFEAECLIRHYLSLQLSDIYLDKDFGEADTTLIDAAVQKRLAHEPLQYILGTWEFMGYSFMLNENVLIPRPETELLCECLEPKIRENSVVYDLCAGTGCIGISIFKRTGASVFSFEKYEGAFEMLQKNIALNHATGVTSVRHDITQKVHVPIPKADFIVSNPPYIKSADLPALQAEVLREPKTALDGGADGLIFYRAIKQNFLDCLKPGGYAAFEIGEGQEKALLSIFSSLKHIQTLKDYNAIERVVIFRKEHE